MCTWALVGSTWSRNWFIEAQWCHQTDVSRLKLVQVMAWCQTGVMMSLWQLDPKKHISVKFYLKFQNFHSRKCIWKCCLQNHVSYSVQGLTHSGLVTPYGDIDLDWVDVGLGDGLLLDGTKPIPELIWTYHWWGPVVFTCKQFHWKCSAFQSVKWVWKIRH